MKNRYVLLLSGLLLFKSCKEINVPTQESLPNVIIIYMDDLGYGDIGAYGATEIKTPNIDFLANNGVRFTDGYASSATCSPSRYALLTGMYPWRNKSAKILSGTAPLIIDTAQQTLPKLFKSKGYTTGVVGKWHLGLGNGYVDWNTRVSPGPNEVGFDYSYIMAATQDRVPTVYLKNGTVQGLDANDPIKVSYVENFEGEPTGKNNPELLTMKWHHGHNNSIVNGIPRIGFMKGGKKARWKDEEMSDNFLTKAKEFIQENKIAPFFLYYALQQPHVPRTPSPRFVGSFGLGSRGDVIVEADWSVGELMKTLKDAGILENTFIVFSSDNGPVLNDGYEDNAVEKIGKHTPSGSLRGGKYSLYEAGTRVPFITYWKGKIEPKVSNALVGQLDLLASLSKLIDVDAKVDDSEDLLSVFMGNSVQGREELIVEATTRTALRKRDWLLIPPYDGPKIEQQVAIELGNGSEYQLYNLKTDIAQSNNVFESQPDVAQEMLEAFIKIRGADFNSIEKLELK